MKLLKFQKPAQYVGGEFFSITKNWQEIPKKVLLVVPTTYEISGNSLGINFLYKAINSRKDSLCERVYFPLEDYKKYLFETKKVLTSLESHRRADEFDILLFSLSSRYAVLNIFEMFELLGISCEKKPVCIAGGVATMNFAPFENFFDAFVVGDGEEVVGEILDIFSQNRENFLSEISKIEGVYVKGISKKVKKRFSPLKTEYYPLTPIIPNIRTFQNRLDIEIMRGCPNNCAFCEARKFYSPLRIRKPDEVVWLVEESIKNTGWEGISFLSLSTSQYPYLIEVVSRILPLLKRKAISLQIPSLRPDIKSLECILKILELNQVNITFAPETFSKRLQKKISKETSFEEFENVLKELKKAGFPDAKIYLLIGLPGEEEDDIAETIKAVKELSKIGLKLKISLSIFVPAPHTPFQDEKIFPVDRLEAHIEKFKTSMKRVALKLPDISYALIESAITTGDENVGKILLNLKGRDIFSVSRWREEFSKLGIDFDEYIRRDFVGYYPWSKVIV